MSALTLISSINGSWDEKELRWLYLETNHATIKRMVEYVELANEYLKHREVTQEEANIMANWFSSHYHCLYVPPYRESQKKTENVYTSSIPGWAIRFTGTFMTQPEYYDTIINFHAYSDVPQLPNWRDDPIIAKLVIGDDNGFSD